MREGDIPNNHNLSVYFLLPLIGLNRDSFLGFVNSFISYNGKIIVEMKGTPEPEYHKHHCYLTDFNQGESLYIVYSLPSEYNQDFSCFLDGKYSQFSRTAKHLIKANSSLPFNVKVGEESRTHKLLMALDKNPALKRWLEEELKMKLSPEAELWNKPDIAKEVMDIDTDFVL